ncbi:MAG TPA: multicopper oxidase domain-containing protein [Ilumatobacteraceae bacterium]|nr:multicopper oxidase domain-containing protein [Ilumatobacteraceae bacterium]
MASEDRTVLGWTSFLVAIGALVIALLFPIIDNDDGVTSAAGAALTVIDVELGALVISPELLTATPGHIQVRVTNVDAQPHNLTVAGQTTKDLQQGESEVLDLGVLGAGSYEMLCEIAGHAPAGMTGALVVGDATAINHEPGHDAAVADYLHGYASWQEMETAMTDRAMAFLDPTIKGEIGGQVLAPEVLPDGTKRFEVTAAITDWEVEPGVIVKAWTYNGVVPAPEISIDVGDKVQIVLTNNLPTATSIHFHGVRVPNAMDGVPPYTQDSVAPGATYTYEFEAIEPAVGIYHSHNGAEQVLDGLFGAFMIGEMTLPEELASQGIDHVDQEVNMVLNDAGVIGLSLNGKSFPATQAYSAKVGDVLMVHYFNEGLLAHPMHLHQPVGWVIAKDGKELLVPMPGDTINIAPGERYTVVYKIQDPGVWAWHCHILTHAEGADGMFGMVTALVVEP